MPFLLCYNHNMKLVQRRYNIVRRGFYVRENADESMEVMYDFFVGNDGNYFYKTITGNGSHFVLARAGTHESVTGIP